MKSERDEIIAPGRRRWCLGMAAATGSVAWRGAQARSHRELAWVDLMPKDWDPRADLGDVRHLAGLPDSDPQVQQMYERMRKLWDDAPTIASLNGAWVKLPGYIVTLEMTQDGLEEFLLVPYFGACVHTPPPPANQIVHVRLATPARGLYSMDPVWVTGQMRVQRGGSEVAISGYSMKADGIVKHKRS